MKKMITISKLSPVVFFLLISRPLFCQLTPMDAINNMGRGINIGNTLEPPDEGGWNNPALEEYYFDDYVAAGFSTIRIPIRWDNHTENVPPYAINETWMSRIEEIVDWGLSRKLFIIINAHHEDWLKNDPSPENLARFDSIWSQIAVRFQDRSDSLFFEMINEPYPMPLSTVDSLNARVLSIIRKTNPTRIVLFSGNMYSGVWDMVQAAVPDDDYLMGYFHSYDPYLFGLEGEGTWGTTSDVNAVKTSFDRAEQWTNETGIPVLLGEFGAVDQCDFNSRSYHYATYVEQALKHHIAFTVWDDGGQFRMYDRQNRKWNHLKNIVTNFSATNPTHLHASNIDGTSVLLQWQNRTSENDSIVIDRGTSPTQWTRVANLDKEATSYTDTGLVTDRAYYYRVIALFNDTTDLLSYPVTITTRLPEATNAESNQKVPILYPNPAGDKIDILLDSDEPVIAVLVYNMKGQLCKKVYPADNNISVPVAMLERGTYVVELITESDSYKTRFIKD